MTNSIPSNLRRPALATLLAVIGFASQAASIEINGDVTMSADLRNSPITALGIGPGATAKAEVNTIDGSAKVGGAVKMTAALNNSPVTGLAIGPGATAIARLNVISGK